MGVEQVSQESYDVSMGEVLAALDRMTESFSGVAQQLEIATSQSERATARYEQDRTFRRVVTGVVSLLAVFALVLAALSVDTSFRVSDQREADTTEACLRSKVFRADLYSAFSAYGSTITDALISEVGLDEELAAEIIADGEAAVRSEVPQRVCPG